jgi:hypothetical protein
MEERFSAAMRAGILPSIVVVMLCVSNPGCQSEPPAQKSPEQIEKARVEHGDQVLKEATGNNE